MPQLPSGRHIGISQDRLYDWAEQAEFAALSEVLLNAQAPDDLHDLIDLIEYADGSAPPSADEPDQGEPYLSEVSIRDIGSPDCPWPEADQQALLTWLHSDRTRGWLEETLQELRAMLADKSAPKATRGMRKDEH
ncbi:hypothetical protein [Aquimonas sp.]|jgi:hypothetical protein|uniref:hypothetical protein n=1 Tax=Aquimonas sp. TaxID=1872588 RepID=UPI0037BF2943